MSRKTFIDKLTEGTAARARIFGGHPMQTSLSLIRTALVAYRRWVIIDTLERVRANGVDNVEADLREEVVDVELLAMMKEKVKLAQSGIEVETPSS